MPPLALRPPPSMSPRMQTVMMAAAAVGAFTVAVKLAKLTSWVKINYLTTCDMKKKYGKAGNWAVVTGASEGIGHAMTIDLARRGFNVCVIARTKSKLDAVVEKLRKLNVEGRAIAFDFSTATEADWTALFAELDQLEIGVLVNNVGINYDFVNYVEEVDTDTHARLIRVNCESTMRMTKYIIPRMKAKRAGAIVILSSFSAVSPAPMLATYAGTKAFNLSFGNAIHWELKEFGVDVLTVTPNVVVSKMTQGKSSRQPKESFLMVNAAAMAHQTLNKIGSTHQTAGHVNHAIFESAFATLPEWYTVGRLLAFAKSVKAYVEKKNAEYLKHATKINPPATS